MSMQDWLCLPRAQSGCADMHCEPVERRGLHAARACKPDAGYYCRGLVDRPRRGEYLGKQKREVPRSVHQIWGVPTGNNQPSCHGPG